LLQSGKVYLPKGERVHREESQKPLLESQSKQKFLWKINF
jgi:hypothetical protein